MSKTLTPRWRRPRRPPAPPAIVTITNKCALCPRAGERRRLYHDTVICQGCYKKLLIGDATGLVIKGAIKLLGGNG